MSKDNNCGRAEDILAYMYDELGPAERVRFENHLVDCMSCIDEFAAVSDARFSVYEWHKEEFARLATPAFSIPFEAAPQRSPGIFGILGEMIRGAGWPAAAAAAVLLSVGLIFAAMLIGSTADDQIASVEPESTSLPSAAAVAELPEAMEPVIENTEAETPPVSAKLGVSDRPAARNPKRLTRKSYPAATRTAAPIMSKAPVLSSYEDNEDRSLRLADLLDEVGG